MDKSLSLKRIPIEPALPEIPASERSDLGGWDFLADSPSVVDRLAAAGMMKASAYLERVQTSTLADIEHVCIERYIGLFGSEDAEETAKELTVLFACLRVFQGRGLTALAAVIAEEEAPETERP